MPLVGTIRLPCLRRTPSHDHKEAAVGTPRQQRKNVRRLRGWITTSALALVAAAGIHLGVAADHGRESVAAGTFFVGAGLIQLLLAAAISVRPSPPVFRATMAANAMLVAVWAAGRVAVVPLSGHSAPEAVGVVDGLAVLAEVAAMAAAFILLRAAPADAHAGTKRRPHRVLSPALAVAAAAVLGLSVPAAAAASGGRGHHEDPPTSGAHAGNGSDHPHSGTGQQHDDADAAHEDQAEELLRSLIATFERDGVCAAVEPRTAPDCHAGG